MNRLSISLHLPCVIAVFFAASGCSTPPTAGESAAIIARSEAVPANRLRIVIYRTKEHLVYLARSIPLRLDGKKLPSLSMGAAVYCDVAPGKHVLESEVFDYPGRFRFEFTPQDAVVFIEAEPRPSSETPILAGVLARNYVQLVAIAVTAGFEEVKISRQGGLFEFQPRSRREIGDRLLRLKAIRYDAEIKEGVSQ